MRSRQLLATTALYGALAAELVACSGQGAGEVVTRAASDAEPTASLGVNHRAGTMMAQFPTGTTIPAAPTSTPTRTPSPTPDGPARAATMKAQFPTGTTIPPANTSTPTRVPTGTVAHTATPTPTSTRESTATATRTPTQPAASPGNAASPTAGAATATPTATATRTAPTYTPSATVAAKPSLKNYSYNAIGILDADYFTKRVNKAISDYRDASIPVFGGGDPAKAKILNDLYADLIKNSLTDERGNVVKQPSGDRIVFGAVLKSLTDPGNPPGTLPTLNDVTALEIAVNASFAGVTVLDPTIRNADPKAVEVKNINQQFASQRYPVYTKTADKGQLDNMAVALRDVMQRTAGKTKTAHVYPVFDDILDQHADHWQSVVRDGSRRQAQDATLDEAEHRRVARRDMMEGWVERWEEKEANRPRGTLRS